MVVYEDNCVNCPSEMGCIGSLCPNANVKRLYCDDCGEEEDSLYVIDGVEVCSYCLLNHNYIERIDCDD